MLHFPQCMICSLCKYANSFYCSTHVLWKQLVLVDVYPDCGGHGRCSERVTSTDLRFSWAHASQLSTQFRGDGIFLSLLQSLCLSVCLSVRPSVRSSVRLSVCLSVIIVYFNIPQSIHSLNQTSISMTDSYDMEYLL